MSGAPTRAPPMLMMLGLFVGCTDDVHVLVHVQPICERSAASRISGLEPTSGWKKLLRAFRRAFLARS